MKTKYTTFKPPAIGAIAGLLMAVSAQASVADESYPIWAGHFKEAYGATSPQTGASSFRSNASPVENRLIWAGHFEQAYSGASQGSRVITHPEAGGHLLWAGQFKQAYQPAGKKEPAGVELAMDRP